MYYLSSVEGLYDVLIYSSVCLSSLVLEVMIQHQLNTKHTYDACSLILNMLLATSQGFINEPFISILR